MEERLKSTAQLPGDDGHAMYISCKTGYKILARSNDSGLKALTDRSRRPVATSINQLPFQIEKLIVPLKADKPK